MKNGPFTVSRRVLPVVAILALSGCSDLDVFGLFEDDPQVAQNASSQDLRDRTNTEQANAENSGTPSLTSVPSRPPAGSDSVRNRVVEGLISDRDNARYTDEAIRLQGSTRPVETPQAASKAPEPASTPAPATAQIAVTPPPAPPAPSTQIAHPRRHRRHPRLRHGLRHRWFRPRRSHLFLRLRPRRAPPHRPSLLWWI